MIRFATTADVAAMLAIYAPYVENTAFSFEYAPPSYEAFLNRFTNYTRQLPWLVWEENGQVLGYAYGSLPFERAAYAWCAEVSVYLAPQVHGQGIGKKLYAVLEEILWRQGYRKIYALITSENTGSLAFHQKVGYRFSAEFPNCGFKFGRWLGVTWLEKEANIVEIPSGFPVPWYVIVKNDEDWQNILALLSLS